MKAIAIIPARYDSSRFPGKPLSMIGDKSMIRRVYERVRLSGIKDVIVATDDKRIKDHAEKFGAEVIMTSKKHQSGTERCAEAYRKSGKSSDIVINIQGDEPFIEPWHIKLLTKAFSKKEVQIATLADHFEDQDSLFSPNTVKIVTDKNNMSMYFSRSVIPFIRDSNTSEWIEKTSFLRHVGIYAFRSSVLQEVVKLQPNQIEASESLEQLRWLYHGYKIKIIECTYHGISVDTPEDLERANYLLNTIYG